jgi:hypothetical protein
MVNWEGCEGRVMASSRYWPSACLEKLRKTTKISVTGVLAVIQIEHMLNILQHKTHPLVLASANACGHACLCACVHDAACRGEGDRNENFLLPTLLLVPQLLLSMWYVFRPVLVTEDESAHCCFLFITHYLYSIIVDGYTHKL